MQTDTPLIGWQAWTRLSPLYQATVAEVHLVIFDFHAQLDFTSPELELVTQDERIFRLSGAHGGDTIALECTAWEDPYPEPITAEQRTEINTYGHLRLIDVSSQPPYHELIGQRVEALYPLISQFHQLAGIRFRIGRAWFNFIAQADETALLWGKASQQLRALGLQLYE